MAARVVTYLARHHWGILATFIALGGTGYAMAELPPHSVGTRQLKQGSVGTDQLKDASVGTTQLKRGAVTLAKINRNTRAALQQPTGPAGGDLSGSYPNPTLKPGTIPAIDGYSARSPGGSGPPTRVSVTVPPGDYVANGGCTGANYDQNQVITFALFTAVLSSSAQGSDPQYGTPGTYGSTASVPNAGARNPFGHGLTTVGYSSLANGGGFLLPQGGTISEVCAAGSPDIPQVYVSDVYVNAVRVRTTQVSNLGPGSTSARSG